MDTGEGGQGWQEVRGRRAEKRAQGGSTGASPAKPEPQRRAVEASGGGSTAQQQDNSEQVGDADDAGEKQVAVVTEAAQVAQQQRPPRAAAPTGSRAARRAKQVGGSIVDASTTTSGGLRDNGSESEESERSRGNVTTSSAGQLGRQLEKATVEDGAAQVNVVDSSSSSRVATLSSTCTRWRWLAHDKYQNLCRV